MPTTISLDYSTGSDIYYIDRFGQTPYIAKGVVKSMNVAINENGDIKTTVRYLPNGSELIADLTNSDIHAASLAELEVKLDQMVNNFAG